MDVPQLEQVAADVRDCERGEAEHDGPLDHDLHLLLPLVLLGLVRVRVRVRVMTSLSSWRSACTRHWRQCRGGARCGATLGLSSLWGGRVRELGRREGLSVWVREGLHRPLQRPPGDRFPRPSNPRCSPAKARREAVAPEQSLLTIVRRWSGSSTHPVQDAMLRLFLQHAVLDLH